jgi:hypothetical protein
MITRDDALTAGEFHEEHEPAGKVYAWRRNGQTQITMTRPDDFRVPVMYGLRSHHQITPDNAHRFHRADQCLTLRVRVAIPDGGGEWYGIVIEELLADNAGYGVTRVHVTTRGASRYRVGSQVDVPTKRLTYL